MKNRRRKRKLKKSVKITLVSLLVIGLLSYPTYKLLTKEKTTTNKTSRVSKKKKALRTITNSSRRQPNSFISI